MKIAPRKIGTSEGGSMRGGSSIRGGRGGGLAAK
jgi:zinc-finger of a C2HC-type